MESKSNYYDILGIDKNANAEDIKKAYRKKSMLTHPDRNRDDPDANSKFQQVSEAYDILSDKQNMLLENQEMRDMVKDMIPKIGNNNTTINNKFNLQFFLNEECKDAINLTDFVQTLQLELGDLDKTRTGGYVSGITNIFVRGLKELELHKRPIHCSDLKREVLYVKDNDTWEKDNSEKQIMKQAINTVAKKQIDIIKEWEASNPDWNKTETGTKMYIDMVRNVTDTTDNENKIIKTIAKEVIIEK